MARTGRETLELTSRAGVRIGQQEVHPGFCRNQREWQKPFSV